LGDKVLDKIVCPRCKAQITLIPNLKEMTAAIDGHLEIHANKLRSKNYPEPEISKQKSLIESALIEEMIKEIYDKYASSIQER
jgi:hypothetical protein